jgi:hypothetical protein
MPSRPKAQVRGEVASRFGPRRTDGGLKQAADNQWLKLTGPPSWYAELRLALFDRQPLVHSPARVKHQTVADDRLGMKEADKGNLEEAIIEYEIAIAIDPSFAAAYNNERSVAAKSVTAGKMLARRRRLRRGSA